MTITEIAQLADVSKACVSRYFNHGYVSEEKKKESARLLKQPATRQAAPISCLPKKVPPSVL
ncbi:LacI family DNA-binding transcriptional regulator [Ventrimonas sp. CLA-AP-H27]|uniref:LacI family DNA-binding transcriptional regulator n=1 Tax=Ventrimonas faecis TaxID=3133170 RepID=A0ABV1HK35_9FIRM